MSEQEDAERITHRRECRGPRIRTFIGFAGDQITKCQACQRSVVAGGGALLNPLTWLMPGLNIVCPTHYGPIRPNGRGCKACALEIAQNNNRRKKDT